MLVLIVFGEEFFLLFRNTSDILKLIFSAIICKYLDKYLTNLLETQPTNSLVLKLQPKFSYIFTDRPHRKCYIFRIFINSRFLSYQSILGLIGGTL